MAWAGFLACRWKECSKKITVSWKANNKSNKNSCVWNALSVQLGLREGVRERELAVCRDIAVVVSSLAHTLAHSFAPCRSCSRSHTLRCPLSCCGEMMRQSIKWGCPKATAASLSAGTAGSAAVAAAVYCNINQNQRQNRETYTLGSYFSVCRKSVCARKRRRARTSCVPSVERKCSHVSKIVRYVEINKFGLQHAMQIKTKPSRWTAEAAAHGSMFAMVINTWGCGTS